MTAIPAPASLARVVPFAMAPFAMAPFAMAPFAMALLATAWSTASATAQAGKTDTKATVPWQQGGKAQQDAQGQRRAFIIQTQIDRAYKAAEKKNWDEVIRCASAILRLDSEHKEATALLAAAKAKKQGKSPSSGQLKSIIDQMVHRLAETERDSGIDAAQYLVALVHCPRLYDMQDGPLIQSPLRVIWKTRRTNGFWGATEANFQRDTAWVYQALHDLDADHFASDLTKIKASFRMRFGLKGQKLEQALKPYDPASYVKPDREGRVARLLATVAAYERTKQPDIKKRAPKYEAFQQRGLDWLLTKQSDGVWRVPGPDGKLVPDPGTTALCLAALASKPKDQRTARENEIIDQGVKFLLTVQGEDGSFSSYLPNYMTCAAVLALSRAKIPGTGEAMKKAQRFLLFLQNVEGRGYRRSNRDYGSLGYGNDRRGDLSNTQMAVEALRITGIQPEHESIQKALVFLRRLQNIPGKEGFVGTRTTSDGRKVPVRTGDDGGAAYYPGNSPAGYDETSDGTQIPRSYGSMTYALLKCYVLAGLHKDDPRLKAAMNWCLSNFTLDENPGAKPGSDEKVKYQGLFYYYLTLARALSLAEIDDIKGRDWRKELRTKLSSLQQADGSWVNERNGRWWEDNHVLCTAYALLALAE